MPFHLLARLALLIPCLICIGCTANAYRKRADKDVYKIIAQVEQDIFGSSSEFSIDTEYSERDADGVTSQEILDERNRGQILELPIDEMLTLSVRKSREYQSEKEQLYLTALTLTGERHAFHPQFFANSTATGTRLSDGQRLGTVSTDIGVGQFLATGANLGVSIANDLLRFYTGDPRRSATSVLQFNILQPLLRGAGWKIAMEQLTQAHRNVIYGIRDFSHFQNTFSFDLVVDYFRLLQQKQTIYNEYSNYLSRVNTTEYLRARSVDRVPPLDVSQAEQAELSAKSRYIDSIASFKNALDGFKVQLGIPQTVDLRLTDSEMTRLEEAGPLSLNLTPDSAFLIALKHRLPLLNSIDSFEDTKRRVYIAADRLKPGLDLFGNASVDSDAPTNYEDFDFSQVQANVGIELNLPLNRLNERNDYRATLINFQSEIRSLSRTFDELRNTIDQGLRQLSQFRQNYEIQTNAVRLAERRVEGAELNMRAGNAVLRDLEEAQDALIEAQNAVTDALVNYLEARLNLLLELGVLDTTEEAFWISESPGKVELPKFDQQPTESLLESDAVIPPDQLFPTTS